MKSTCAARAGALSSKECAVSSIGRSPVENSRRQAEDVPLKQWHSVGYRRPGRTAILSPPKVVRCRMLSLITPIFAAPLDCRPGRSSPSASPSCNATALKTTLHYGQFGFDRHILSTRSERTLFRYRLSTLETIVATFGDSLSPNSATTENGDSRRKRQQSPFLVTVADYSLQCGQGFMVFHCCLVHFSRFSQSYTFFLHYRRAVSDWILLLRSIMYLHEEHIGWVKKLAWLLLQLKFSAYTLYEVHNHYRIHNS